MNPDVHAEIIKAPTHILGFDEITDGGIPRGRTTLVIGGPGSGKTIFALIEKSISRGESALYISFDESSKEMVRNLSSVNICLEPYIQSGLLRMYSARTESRSGEEHLMNIRRLIEKHRPTCMVVDPLSALSLGLRRDGNRE